MKAWLGGVVVAVIAGGWAHADPRLDEKVYDPFVEKGVLEVEARSAGLAGAVDGGRSKAVLEFEYGFTDHLSLALVGVASQNPHAGGQWSNVGLEAVYALGQNPRTGVDAGLYLEYGHGLNGEADFVEAKLLLAKRAGRFEGLLNLIVERPLNGPGGENVGSYGYAASATWRVEGGFRLGAEALGDFGSDHRFLGRQGAYVGPQVKWAFHPFGGDRDPDGDNDADEGQVQPLAADGHRGPPIEIDLDAGWLAAVGPDRGEAASQVRVGLEIERRF